jgi:hypothetical protein
LAKADVPVWVISRVRGGSCRPQVKEAHLALSRCLEVDAEEEAGLEIGSTPNLKPAALAVEATCTVAQAQVESLVKETTEAMEHLVTLVVEVVVQGEPEAMRPQSARLIPVVEVEPV